MEPKDLKYPDWGTLSKINIADYYNFNAEEKRRNIVDYYNKIVLNPNKDNKDIEDIWIQILENSPMIKINFGTWIIDQPDFDENKSIYEFNWQHVLRFISHAAYVFEMQSIVEEYKSNHKVKV